MQTVKGENKFLNLLIERKHQFDDIGQFLKNQNIKYSLVRDELHEQKKRILSKTPCKIKLRVEGTEYHLFKGCMGQVRLIFYRSI